MEFSAEEILNEDVCQWCAKKDCEVRNKIVGMYHCKDLKFDPTQRERHDAWNATRQKVCLAHALCCKPPHMFDDENFRQWVRETYHGKKIHI